MVGGAIRVGVGAAMLSLALGGPAGASVPAATADPAAPVAPPVLVPLFGGSQADPSPAGSPGERGSAGPSAAPSANGSSPVPGPSAGPEAPAQPASPDPGFGQPLDPALVTAALDPVLRGGALGSGRSPAQVVDVATGMVLYSARASTATVPASTMKLVTAVSVLDALGPDHQLRTRAVILNPAAQIPRVVLVGGGDPSLRSTGQRVGGTGTSLTPSSLDELVDATARALAVRGVERVRVGYDDSLFSGPALHPSWRTSFVAGGIVAPVSALQVDQGRRTPSGSARVPDPAQAAAARFAEQLQAAGIRVRGAPRQVSERPDSVALASVTSPTIGVLVERMNATSDNDFAEALARLGALAAGYPGSFAGAAQHAADVLAGLGIDTAADRFADGSGLSRDNALTARTLTAVLSATSTQFGSVPSGLPVGGVTGSLRNRYGSAATEVARGLVRAKTGTLTGVVSLAGYVSRPDGRLLAFAVLDDSVPGGAFSGRADIDRAVAQLVACDCALP